MGSVGGFSKHNASSTRLATQRREAEKRGEGETAVSDALSTISDADCRIQHRTSKNDGSAEFATCSCCPAVLCARDPPLGYDYEHPISGTALEATTVEEAFWLSGASNEPVDTSDLFGAVGGVIGEETGGSAFLVEGGLVQE